MQDDDEISLRIGELTIGHQPDTGRFTSAFFAEDDLGAIIRCHFEVERAAIRSLDVITQGRWKKTRSQYLSEKLNLLEVVGAPLKLLAPARILNKQRNEFAHDGIDAISEQQSLDLLRSLRAFYPTFNDDYRVIFHGLRQFDAAFRDCTLRQRYVATAMFLTLLIGGIPELIAAYRQVMRARSSTLET